MCIRVHVCVCVQCVEFSPYWPPSVWLSPRGCLKGRDNDAIKPTDVSYGSLHDSEVQCEETDLADVQRSCWWRLADRLLKWPTNIIVVVRARVCMRVSER